MHLFWAINSKNFVITILFRENVAQPAVPMPGTPLTASLLPKSNLPTPNVPMPGVPMPKPAVNSLGTSTETPCSA